MNILILSASTGGGHKRASGALKKYITGEDPSAKVDIIDTIEECSSLLNFTVVKGYKALIKLSPALFGAIYRSADKKSPVSDVINVVYQQCAKRLYPVIESYAPDVIISCHPFAGSILGYIKTHFGYSVPLISIVTDFLPHRAYIAEGIDAYITASDKARTLLTEDYGIAEDRIFDYGHPVYETFYEGSGRSREEVLTELGLSLDKRTVLIMAGSFGVTDILRIYENLLGVDLDFQIIVITGNNRKLYEAFEQLLNDNEEIVTEDEPDSIRMLSEDNILRIIYERSENALEQLPGTFRPTTHKKKPTRLFFFVDNVDDYMHAADLLVTKPGGLTASESIACALPMAVFQAVQGQESQNAELLEENGIGVIIKKSGEAAEKVGELLKDSEKLEEMRSRCREFVRKNSCRNIYELAKKLAAEKTEQ